MPRRRRQAGVAFTRWLSSITLKQLILLAAPFALLAALASPPIAHAPADSVVPNKQYYVVGVMNHPDYQNTYLYLLRDQDGSFKVFSCLYTLVDTMPRMAPRRFIIEAVEDSAFSRYVRLSYRVRMNPYFTQPLEDMPYFPDPDPLPPPNTVVAQPRLPVGHQMAATVFP